MGATGRVLAAVETGRKCKAVITPVEASVPYRKPIDTRSTDGVLAQHTIDF